MKSVRICVAALVLLMWAAASQAQEFAKPGPEHAFLKEGAGVWEAHTKFYMEPGKPPSESKGSMTSRMDVGGLWLIGDFKGDFGGMPFAGHSVEGYDPAKKKYVGVWVDSMSTAVYRTESTYDAGTKTMKGTLEGPDPTGNIVKIRTVTEYKDKDTMVFKMYNPSGDGGKEQLTMEITYKRKK